MSKIIMFIFCINLLQGEGAEDISFRYGFMGQLQSNPDSTVELSDKSIVQTDDAVSINIAYLKDSYFYLIYLDSDGNYSLNLPEDSTDENSQDTLYTTVLQGWLTNPPGDESFYLINSKLPLSYLNKLLSRYENAPDKAIIKLAKKIQVELDVLDPNAKAELSSIASRLDKPLVGGVTFRGDGDDDLKDMSLTHECRGTGGIAFIKIVLNHK